jgi:hypothetical protein
MYSGKTFSFIKTIDGYELAGNRLLKTDIRVFYSQIHIVAGMNPNPLNIWEYIGKEEGLDSLRSYINSITTMKLFSNVYFNGIFRDTITLPQNNLLEYLAKINLEDSIYTVLLPDNEAFKEAYNHIIPFCQFPAGVSENANAAKWMMLRELIFRDKLSLPTNKDFIYSVSGTKYDHPDSMFLSSITKTELSNGIAYKVHHLKAFELGFQKRPIRIEVEDRLLNKVTSNNYELNSVTNKNPEFEISNNKYMLCKPTSSSSLSPLNIFVPLLNTYAMKYNIYVGFVPTFITDTTDRRPYKLDFYYTSNGDVASGSPTFTKLNTTNVLTNPITSTKVLVAEGFQFPACTIDLSTNTSTKYQLKIRNMCGTTVAETKNYNRTLRIDYVLLEPVE